jgi:carboxyl-terminal processing protease
MKSFSFSRIRPLVIALAFIVLAGGIGYRLGEQHALPQLSGNSEKVVPKTVKNTPAPEEVSADFAIFWDVWQKMFRYFIDAQKLDAQKMVYGAISGMVAAAGDPYTTFLPPKENKDFKQDIGGQFEGIGAQLDLKDGKIIVTSPLKDSPAEAAGIKPQDYIMKVDGVDTTGWSIQEAVSKIRGPKGTTVTLTILHAGNREPVDIPVVRNTIMVPSVESWVKAAGDIVEIHSATEAAELKKQSDRIGYLKLSRFGDHTNEDWNKAVSYLLIEHRRNPLAGIVFDLRNNPGGYLDGSVYIASEFISSGTIVSQKNSDGTVQSLQVNRKGRLTDIPLVVLINKGSASAAEIVSGALKDYKRATIVGERSFGKGSVQTPYELAQGASVHITTGKWVLPNGDSISEKGITPDIAVQYDYADPNADTQLAKAIEVLLRNAL